MELDEAIGILIELLQTNRAHRYGYDLYPRVGAEAAVRQLRNLQHFEQDAAVIDLTPIFFDAAWELSQRGIVRPGVRRTGEQSVDDGGYSLTALGRASLQQLDASAILLARPGSLSATFAQYERRFGSGFHQRAQEAIRCRDARAWLACCSMVGAAAESIILALAIAKTADETTVLTAYRRASGRQQVLNLIVGRAPAPLRDTLTTFARIVSLWRDEAAHGRASPLTTANADEGLRQLLHMCQWVEREWDHLTA